MNGRSQTPPGGGTAVTGEAPSRRWLVLVVIATAQLMVVLDISVVNIALPSAQRALHFSGDERQWVITAYALAFGSLLLFGGKIGDLFGRKRAFIVGLIGFAVVSAVGGAATGFTMLVVARACQGAFGALLAPAALSLLTTTFSDSKERGTAFGVFGAVAVGGGAVGLLLGGALTEYLSWRYTLYVNLLFALVAVIGAAWLLPGDSRRRSRKLDILGVLTGSGAMFCLVYGFSNAATHNWHTPSTWGFLAAAGVLLVAFIVRESRADDPLLPPRILGDRNRGGANVAVLTASAGMFAIFLFLTYYMQQTLHYSPVMTGVAFLPMVVMVMVFANVANIILLPRVGPKLLISGGLLLAAGGMAWLTGIGVHTPYVGAVLGPEFAIGTGLGLAMSSSMNTGTFGVAAAEAGVASASLNTGQQIGGSVGTSLLNTVAQRATKGYASAHAATLHAAPSSAAGRALAGAAAVHGYVTAFWWALAIFAAGAVIAGLLLRFGTPATARQPGTSPAPAEARQAGAGMRPASPNKLAGTVKTAGNGSPVREADVTLRGPAGSVVAERQTDTEGRYRFEALPAADYVLAASAPSFQPAALTVTVAGEDEVTADLELRANAG